MNIKNILRATVLVVATFCFANTFPNHCQARTMTIDWGVPAMTAEQTEASKPDPDMKSDPDVLATRADALNAAIVRATTEEAFGLLPKNLPAAQKTALKKYLASKAHTLVRGYREESARRLPSGQQRLVVDVNVDKQWLTEALQRLGVFYLAGHDALPCTFYYIGQTAADKKSSAYKNAVNYVGLLSSAAGMRSNGLTFMTTAELFEMDKLAGVGQVMPIPSADVANANDAIAEALNAAKVSASQEVQIVPQKPKGPQSLRFLLIPQGKNAWSAKLQAPEYNAKIDGSTIDMVWGNLWPNYLSSRLASGTSAPGDSGDIDSDMSTLQVWGWSSADGVLALDKAMRQWNHKQGGVSRDLDLVKMTMQAGAVKAIWRLDMAEQSKLKAFIRDYASQRRLRYEFAAASTGLGE